ESFFHASLLTQRVLCATSLISAPARGNSEPNRYLNPTERSLPVSIALRPQLRPNRLDDRLRQPVHLLLRLRLNHHPRQRLGAGITYHHPAIAVEFPLRRRNRRLHCRNLRKGSFSPHSHIPNRLRKYFYIAHQLGQRLARPNHDLHYPERGQKSVAGGRFPIAKQDVARLFAAERSSHALHFFEHILIADIGTQHLNAGALERQLQSHI